jgi:neutral ceramidase
MIAKTPILAAASLAFLGCNSLRSRGLSEATSDLRRREPGLLLAGAARVDVTPPPGPSLFGHGSDARVADGYWSRLQCRVFVLETNPEDRIVLVPCDLHSISAIMHREVAEKVQAIVPTSRLLITATHTHAGPAHYFESALYGGFSSTRRPGFDPAMLDFLANRIASGVVEAFAARRPAAARWVHTAAWKLTRNRSLKAHRANLLPFVAKAPAGLALSDEERAIDPALDVLQIEAVDAEARLLGPIGWLVFFAMHPTVVGSSSRLYGADVFGVSSRLLEAELRRVWADRCRSPSLEGCARNVDPLAALLNTNEGDISPIWSSGGVEEAIGVGRGLAESAWATHSSDESFRRRMVVDSRYLESELSGAAFPPAQKRPGLCFAEMGAAASHGASDHPIAIASVLGEGSVVDTTRDDCQAPKKRLMGPLQTLLVGSSASSFPGHAPIALVRIDDTFLSFVPAEFTVQAGAALDARVLAQVRVEDDRTPHALVVGLANAYVLYVTTRREYQVQSYEGGSTLYGPASAEYFAERAALLARSIVGEPIDADLGAAEPRIGQAVAFDYELAPRRARMPAANGAPAASAMREPRRQRGLCRIGMSRPAAVCFWWSDASPGQVPITSSPWLSLVSASTGLTVRTCQSREPMPSALASVCDPGASVDDRGLDFQTRVRGRSSDAWLWSTLLQMSPGEWASLEKGEGVRVKVEGVAGLPAVEPDVFSAASMPAECSDEAVRFCLGDREPEPH